MIGTSRTPGGTASPTGSPTGPPASAFTIRAKTENRRAWVSMARTLTIPLPGLDATRALAAALAGLVRPGDVVALTGDLGAGKTAFARGLIQALLGPDEEVPSPTFTLVQTYDTRPGTIWHFDLYRLTNPQDIVELGWDEARAGIILVEWPDRLGPLLPDDRLDVVLDWAPESAAEPDRRLARLAAGGSWEERLDRLAAGGRKAADTDLDEHG